MAHDEGETARARLLAYISREIDIEDAPLGIQRLRAERDFSKACQADPTFAQRFFSKYGHDAPRELWGYGQPNA